MTTKPVLPTLPTPATAAKVQTMANKPETTAKTEGKPSTTKKKASKPETVTMTKADLDALIASATTAAVQAAVAAVSTQPKGKAKKTDEEKAAKKAALAQERAAKKAAQKNANDTKKAAHAKASGKTLDEVKEAWADAHRFAREDQKAYKERFDAKLKELLGVVRFAA